jgi:multiple sugar transport system permease protein
MNLPNVREFIGPSLNLPSSNSCSRRTALVRPRQEIRVELEEAATVDGDSRLSALLRITLPLAAPGLAATAFFAVIATYNEFVFALILTSTDDTMTVPVGTATLSFKTSVGWGAMTAMAVIGIFPVIVLAIALQQHFVRGRTLGAIK